MRNARNAFIVGLLALLLAAVPAHAFNTRAGSDIEGPRGEITPELVKSEAEARAQKLQDSLPRGFMFYGRPPRDQKEFTALAKYMVYLFTVWTQKPQELPIKRIFIRATRGEEIPVPNVLSWRMPIEQGSDRKSTRLNSSH